MLEQYRKNIKIGQDALDPGVKKAKFENKARIQEQGRDGVQSDAEILAEAEEKAESSRFRGPVDPGPLTD